MYILLNILIYSLDIIGSEVGFNKGIYIFNKYVYIYFNLEDII